MLLGQLAQGLFGLGQFGAFFLDDFGWRLVNETGVGQLAADSLHFTLQTLDFLVQTRQFRTFVDQAGPVSYTHLTLPTILLV